jgi:hypothetical protein
MAKDITQPPADKPRLLFIVSKDYGELCWALSFLQGQDFASQTTLMLPQQMYEGNAGSLAVEASPYSTLNDVLAGVEAHKPDIVFLLSGYLLSNDKLMSRASLEQLVTELRDGIRVVATSDPFAGLTSRLKASDIDTNMALLGQNVIKRVLYRMVLRFRTIENFMRIPSLENLTHLYATSTPPADDKDTVSRLSFFNPNILNSTVSNISRYGLKSQADVQDTPHKRWLFVLSTTDLGCQNATLGEAEFARSVVRMIAQALDAGKKPTLLAPASIIEILAGEFPASTGVELLLFCPYTEFVPRLLDAEYVFYWNVFSCSLLLRMANELPLFFFDRGHLSRTIKPFYDLALRTHFGEWTPTFLDQGDPLEPNSLAKLAADQQSALRAVRQYWQASPTPQAVIDDLLNNRVHQTILPSPPAGKE